ncbi:prepilin-type N-terminal cleavage/methylation domain-containing protein [Parahaliea maris]|uniref:Prepilin-type N-terminal cleavage/methylation domain-containing protein n=1 Tax=Parahaliea maris TaxID=2716870 RepID=A0A5C8ZSE6_9GAMM|nr:prepilin-type N-terminal cleavage/methylation domain-containing protein [Parahaliea maris]TXS91325.1 prepilin-type N-terminal cleavage/methylation domain-containing protein [Parahaliea maris]
MRATDFRASRARRPHRQRGFSLLEMVVAIAVLGVSLGALYQAAGGASRNIRTDEKYAFGVELAQSLLADVAQVPVSGFRDGGATEGGFLWEVVATPLPQIEKGLPAGVLQDVEVVVAWQDGRHRREVRLNSVVEGVQTR